VETHVKERLTGALILVALLVVVVPEMLSGPAARESGAAVTDEDGPPLRTYSMDLGAPEIGAADQSALAPQSPASTVEEKPAVVAAQERGAPAERDATPAAVENVESEPIDAMADVPLAPPSVAAAGSRWWVQIGSFSQSANAGRIARQLGDAGFPAVVSPVKSNGKELFRVRAGPVADRGAAEALRNRLAAAGHKGTLVAP
jgi:DedD protein